MGDAIDIRNLEKRVIAEEEEIERLEEKIAKKEEKILSTQRKVLGKVGAAIPKYHIKFFRSGVLRRFGRHKVLYSFVTLVSVILIWTGISTFVSNLPIISNPLISIPLGLGIVWFIDRELV